MKKNKINYDAAMKQFDALLPDELVDPFKNALTVCKDATAGEKNACEAASKFLVCFYNNNPNFTFAWDGRIRFEWHTFKKCILSNYHVEYCYK